MTKISRQIFLSLMFGFLTWYAAVGVCSAVESAFFFQKDKDFWVLKNKAAFTDAARALIDDNGEWKGEPPIPQYIKFSEQLAEEDLPTLVRWLSLKELKCFGIAGHVEQLNLSLINGWRRGLIESGEDLSKLHLEKLAWLNFQTTLNQMGRGEASILSANWIETNRAFLMQDSHYFPIVTY